MPRFKINKETHDCTHVLLRLVVQWIIVPYLSLWNIHHDGSPVTSPFVERKTQEPVFQEAGADPSPHLRVIILDKLTRGLFRAAQLCHENGERSKQSLYSCSSLMHSASTILSLSHRPVESRPNCSAVTTTTPPLRLHGTSSTISRRLRQVKARNTRSTSVGSTSGSFLGALTTSAVSMFKPAG
mmetsp:Transcript_25571/g.52451  ORF Transcript_25571/g.52451 Transcript_25571/m.52451 type:complete len:184 (-) Transcript_25571:131-682(-)